MRQASLLLERWINYLLKDVRLPTWVTLKDVRLVSERTVNGMDFLTFKVSFIASPSTDVKKRQLSVKVDDQEPTMKDVDPAATDTEFEVPQDSNVVLTEVITDDAGNVSNGSPLSFVATDTLSPVVGGELKVEGPVSERSEP